MSKRGICLGVALLLVGGAVRGGEVEATPVCRPYGPSTSYYGDPCCRVGPVRRFLRRVFHPCCPPPVVRYAPVPVVVPCPAPCPTLAPAAWVPPGPPVSLERPIAPQGTVPPPPPMDVPSSLKRDDLPRPTPPVRFDRIASRQGSESQAGQLVTLVQVGKPDARKRTETDAEGRFSVELTPGTWVVYVGSAEQGRLVIRERKVVRVRIHEAG